MEISALLTTAKASLDFAKNFKEQYDYIKTSDEKFESAKVKELYYDSIDKIRDLQDLVRELKEALEERESISFKPEGWITIDGREGLKYCGICHGEMGKLIPLQTTENPSTGKINYECGCNKGHRFNGDGTPKRTGAMPIIG